MDEVFGHFAQGKHYEVEFELSAVDAFTLTLPTMKKRSAAITLAALVLVGVIILGWTLERRAEQKEWPWQQLANAVKLARAVSMHHEKFGVYPDSLRDLVTKGSLETEEFEKLSFRASPTAPPEQWLYRVPHQSNDMMIISPRLVYPWRGHSGLRVTARQDGGGELIPTSKSYILPAWVSD